MTPPTENLAHNRLLVAPHPPIFPQGYQSKRNASARENRLFSRFARSTIPEEKWGTTRSLGSQRPVILTF